MPRAPLTPISNNRRLKNEFSPYLRGQIVAIHNNVMKNAQIARQLNLSRESVRYTLENDTKERACHDLVDQRQLVNRLSVILNKLLSAIPSLPIPKFAFKLLSRYQTTLFFELFANLNMGTREPSKSLH